MDKPSEMSSTVAILWATCLGAKRGYIHIRNFSYGRMAVKRFELIRTTAVQPWGLVVTKTHLAMFLTRCEHYLNSAVLFV